MRQRYLILCILFTFPFCARAQKMEIDTAHSKVNDSLVNISWLADSSFRAFKTENFDALKPFFPTFKTYQKYVDTAKVGEQSDYTQFMMFESLAAGLRLQYKRMMKAAKKQSIKMNKLIYDKTITEVDSFQGHVFAYIHLIAKKGEKKKIQIRYTCLRIDNHWYMLDELKLLPYNEEKKKAPVPVD